LGKLKLSEYLLRVGDHWKYLFKYLFLLTIDTIQSSRNRRLSFLPDLYGTIIGCKIVVDALSSTHHDINGGCKMRTTLDIDQDVLIAAKELARQKNLSAGQVVSQLLRKVLTGQTENNTVLTSDSGGLSVAGFRPFPAGKAVVTNEAVNRLRDAEGI
jgi:hypothetical protein